VHRRRLLLIALIFMLTVLGSPVAAQEATPTPPAAADALFVEPVELPELRITVTESGYEGVPSELAAGRYLVTVTNASSGGGGAEFAGMTEDVTLEEFLAWWDDFQTNLAAQAAGATPTVELDESIGGLDVPGPWPFEAYLAGGPYTEIPGQTVQGVVDLVPGDYVVWNDNPFLPQKPVPLRVTGEVATPAAATVPPADLTVRYVGTDTGRGIDLTGELAPGPQVIQFVAESDAPHFTFLFRAPGPVTAEQVVRAMDVPEGGTPPADVGFDPEQLMLLAATQTQSAGTTQWLATNLEPGTYVLTCLWVDRENDYRLHAFEGELTVLTVGDAGTPVP
jgi:hypothetical protein